jgi:hypothetical protein
MDKGTTLTELAALIDNANLYDTDKLPSTKINTQRNTGVITVGYRW